ncbi:MAG: type pilus assembly PilZ [bacterium]|nr:type pilus assembly PilZ [bacterium]
MTMLTPMVRIKYKCESVESFIEKYHSDVNPIGIFVRTRSPVLAGTAISFDFRLRDDEPLFMGTGVVVWARQDDLLAPLLDPGMMLSFDQLSHDSRQTFDYVLSQKRALEEALDAVPTLVRTFVDDGGASDRPLPMTTKMSAEEMEGLRVRMREDMPADAGACAAPVQPPPEPQPQPEPEPEPEPIRASLAKVLVLERQPHQAAGVIEARPRTPGEITASTESAANHWVQLIGVGIVSWMLVLVLVVMIRWDLLRRMLEWIHST